MNKTLKTPPAARRARQRGVSLVEVLVSLLILALGLVGMAGLQMHALRANQSATERSAAVLQTYFIAGAMSADPQQAIEGKYNVDFASSGGPGFAGNQIKKWKDNIVATVGVGAKGKIDCTAATRICEVTIQWDDSRADKNADTAADSENFQLVTEVAL